ncbi:hypothetical protein PVK06_044086 [Gossypium arboreum]|uniref:Late embryogenesis abundant protein LEA-2 subgroup domain-containing protein n=1 Tax=Gossypium arboreum TaxID=29729 RepID=A0ABR0MQ62_GOSAR|nr:hypothetical protein PVK06_044086 [Gossypium arboreum]
MHTSNTKHHLIFQVIAEPPLKPVLQKPPGYKDPKAAQFGFRPPPRKPVLPPSFNPRKRNRSFYRVCCCWLCIFVLVLVLLAVIGGLVFYIWFDPKFPVFHIRSFRITHFNITERPDGTYLDAATTTRLEMKNPNVKITYYYCETEVGVSVGEGGVRLRWERRRFRVSLCGNRARRA